MANQHRYQSFIHDALLTLTTDKETIEWRQAILRDFIENPQLAERVRALLPNLASLGQHNPLLGRKQRSPLAQTSEQLAELEIYIDATQNIYQALEGSRLNSRALAKLRDRLSELIEDSDFQALRDQLPELRRPLEKITSLTIAINLDLQLRPSSAVLLSINDYKVGGLSSFLDRVIGPPNDEIGEHGIAPLNHLTRDPDLRPYDVLFQDLGKLMDHVAKPVAQELARYTRISSQPLLHLEFELAFYLSALNLLKTLENKGVPTCLPEILPMEARSFQLGGMNNVCLCLRQDGQWVASDATMDEHGRIAILTGPNSGGKTTYLQAVGLAQAMAQAGLFVCAEQAQISPVDRILTHFPALETRQQGRLAEEAERLRTLFQQASPFSLVLLNETFSSTSAGEAVYLAQDMLSGLRALGTRAIFATHLVELAEQLEEIQRSINGDSQLYSLVAGIHINEQGEAVRTFRIERGLPLGRSYAREIARRHGISLEQILESTRHKHHDDAP